MLWGSRGAMGQSKLEAFQCYGTCKEGREQQIKINCSLIRTQCVCLLFIIPNSKRLKEFVEM